MSDHENNSVKNQSETPKASNRRRFIKQGVMITPVITTVASRPAWGRDGIMSISGNLSGNLSRDEDTWQPTKFDGKSPGYWKHRTIDRFTTNSIFTIDKDTSFSSLFGFGTTDKTIFEILWDQGNEGTKLEKFALVAYLNSLKFGTAFPYTAQEIVAFYLACKATNSVIDETTAFIILNNLIHNGGGTPGDGYTDPVSDDDAGGNPFEIFKLPHDVYDESIHSCIERQEGSGPNAGVCKKWKYTPPTP